MKKGDRVKIVAGQGEGRCGQVFWVGANKWGPGQRLGVRGDDGQTWWVSEADAESSDEPAPVVEPGPTFQRGDEVVCTVGGGQVRGTVFWVGESRRGSGQRLGVRPDDDDEAVWLDARFARLVDGQDSAASASASASAPAPAPARQEEPGELVEYAAPLGSDEGPPVPPMDNDYIEQMAASWDEEADVPIPDDW